MRIYLAGPLFSLAERSFNELLSEALIALGHAVFLPQSGGKMQGSSAAIYQWDVGGIQWCDAVVACLDGPDPDSGTAWELGYAEGIGKITLGYRTDFRVNEGLDKINLMLTEGTDATLYLPNETIERVAERINYQLALIVSRTG